MRTVPRSSLRSFSLRSLLLGGCGTPPPAAPRAEDVRARIATLLPASVPDRAGWAVDIYAAFDALRIEPSTPNICAVLAVTEQESTYRADPPVPGLGKIAREEIDRRAERAGVPKLRASRPRSQLRSPDGRTYSERIDAAKTEKELSDAVRGLHRPGAARPALLRRLEPGAHRRADAGEHRVRRGARAGAALSRIR